MENQILSSPLDGLWAKHLQKVYVGSGMEDVIFSGTSNKPSKNIAEVSITVKNDSGEGPIQYREVNEINVRRKIEKDKDPSFISMIKK